MSATMNRVRLALAAGLLALGGCNSSPYALAPVAGLVTLDGKPLAGAAVEFQPSDPGNVNPGPGSSATTGEDGRYTLQVVGGKAGAVVGPHRVTVSKLAAAAPKRAARGLPEKGGAPAPDAGASEQDAPQLDLVPARYNRATTLKFDVPAGGSQSVDFALTSGK